MRLEYVFVIYYLQVIKDNLFKGYYELVNFFKMFDTNAVLWIFCILDSILIRIKVVGYVKKTVCYCGGYKGLLKKSRQRDRRINFPQIIDCGFFH